MTLRDLKPGESAVVETVGGEGALRQHFLDMGVIPGVTMTLVKLAPMGDPMEFLIHGYELTLRVADAEMIAVRPAESAPVTPKFMITPHPYRTISSMAAAAASISPAPEHTAKISCPSIRVL